MAPSAFGLSIGVLFLGVHGSQSSLGQERSVFGDKTDSAQWKKPSGSRDPWFFQNSTDTYPTLTYFPAGKANERYYINTLEGPAPKGKSFGTLREVLVYETRRNGVIRLEWKADLLDVSHDRSRLPKLSPGLGTMPAMLARSGLIFAGPLSSKISARLNAIEGLAAYRFNKSPAPPGVHYWLVRPNGTDGRHYLDGGKWTSSTVQLPKTIRAYPVTAEEKALSK